MLRLFGKKKKENTIRKLSGGRFMQKMLALQRRIADRLNGKTAGWSRRQQRMFLVIFCLGFGGASLLMGLRAMRLVFAPSVLKSYYHPIVPPLNRMRQPAKPAIMEDIAQVRYYRHLLDSLSRDSVSKPEYEQFVRERPGILDSLRTLERIYSNFEP